ncbi:MAG: hypothetical protein DHS20C02_00550 [Micavibrio sp.]|nr:MAG: hypothetical protein DHS20C02_00550 [Micavibrio sp.]
MAATLRMAMIMTPCALVMMPLRLVILSEIARPIAFDTPLRVIRVMVIGLLVAMIIWGFIRMLDVIFHVFLNMLFGLVMPFAMMTVIIMTAPITTRTRM